MTTRYEEKIETLSNWYEDLILKNRLLLLTDGSHSLQNILLNSSVVSFYIGKSYNHSLVLTNETFGLFQIEFSFRYFSYNTKTRMTILKAFTSFSENHDRYLEVQHESNSNTLGQINFLKFESPDLLLIKKLFEPHLDNITSLINDANDTMVEFIQEKMHKFIQNTSLATLVKNKKGKLVFSFTDGSLVNSPEDLFKKFKKEYEINFLVKHSDALKTANKIKKAMTLKKKDSMQAIK